MYQKNLALIKERFPFLALNQDGEFSQPDLVIDVSRSKTGLPVAQVTRNQHRVFLNSSYDPVLDASRWIEHNLDQNTGHVILCGAGFFYHVKALLELSSIKKLVIYEPSPAVLYAAMQEIDLTPLFEHDNFLLVTGMDYDEMIKGALGFFNDGLLFTATDIQIKILTPYSELFHDEIHIFQEKLREFFRLMQMNLSTTDAYARQWLANAFATFPSAVNSPVIRHYFGQFKNIPAIVVSAGPSLEKNIHLINSIKENAVVICAGSSIRAMKRNGVSPHFLVGVDGHEINNKVYGDLDLSDVYLVYNFRFWQEIVRKYSGRKILMKVDAESLPDLFITQNGGYEIGSLKSGFSVSHTSLNLAFQLGCNPIILVGQDLAYAPTKRYADGQISSSQKYFKEGEIPPNCFYTKDIHGQDILTDYELDSFRMLLERMIETSYQGKVNIINATEGGVHIKGTTEEKLSEVIAEYCRDNRQISRKIASLYERGLHEIRKHKIDPVAYCSKLKIITNRAIIKMIELLDDLQALRKRNFGGELIPGELDPLLEQITNAYDLALNYKEYHVLLKDIQVTALSVNKARLSELDEMKTAEDYDRKLQIYLNIIADTQKALEFVMECITKVIDKSNEGSLDQEAQPLSMERTLGLLAIEKKIKKGMDLKELQRTLETALRESNSPERAMNLYLYGTLLQKKGEISRSIEILEETVKTDSRQVRAHFELFQIYYKNRKFSKALESLEHCCALQYRTGYCRRMQLKINYQTQNWVAAANLATELVKTASYKKAFLLVKIECFSRLGLELEAQQLYQDFKTHYSIVSKVESYFQPILNIMDVNEYQNRYGSNQGFFSHQLGLQLPEYTDIQYKVCRFLSGEYVYDRGSDQILAGVNHAGEIDIKLTLEDCLAVYNTDNTKIFEHLVEALERIPDPKTRRQVSQIPIYFIEDSLENWCFLTQLFEFDKLKSWQNIHYFIASSGGITDIFMKEDAPWPNSFYGTDAESFTKSLLKIKQAKDFTFHQGLFELGNYYRTACLTPNLQPRKILIVTSKKEAALHYYGQVLEDYLVENGFECLLHIESSTFQNFTPYYDIKAMASFRPDLVINFLGVQEEFAAFNSLAVPFISWLLQEKQLNKTLEAHCPNQILLMTGNLNVKNNLLKQGYRPEQIHGVHLPVFPNIKTTSVSEWPEEEIGIITDLDDLEIVINDLATVIHGIIFMKTHTGSLPNIMAALRTLYFQVYAGLNQEELRPMDAAGYEKMLSENLQRYQINLSSDELKFLAGFVKTEFENLIFKRIQVKWVVDVFKDKRIGIYGSGWDQDPTYKNFFKGEINFFSHPEEYRNLILQSKVNLYLGGRLKNKSLMQPDLIQGIAYGGFFLIRKSPSLNPVESVWEPFGELLECYSSRTELFEKLNYFLTHPDERQKRARELQSHVLENFNMGSIIEKFWRLQ